MHFQLMLGDLSLPKMVYAMKCSDQKEFHHSASHLPHADDYEMKLSATLQLDMLLHNARAYLFGLGTSSGSLFLSCSSLFGILLSWLRGCWPFCTMTASLSNNTVVHQRS